MELEFARCSTEVCVSPFTIINDMKVEDVETIDLFIQSEEQALVRADPNIAEVTILDDAESERDKERGSVGEREREREREREGEGEGERERGRGRGRGGGREREGEG